MRNKMNWLCAAAALSVCVRFVSGAEPAPDKTGDAQFSAIDAQIAGAAQQVASLQKSVRESPSDMNSTSQCPDPQQTLTLKRTCEAVVLGDAGACGKSEEIDTANDCKVLYWDFMASEVLIKAAANPVAARRLCLDMMANNNNKGSRRPPIDPNAYCDVYIRYADDAHERVAHLAPLYHMGADSEKTRKMLAAAEEKEHLFMGDDSSVCPAKSGGDWMKRQICLTAHSYRAAFSKKDSNLCGESGLCRALMGRGKDDCAVYAGGLDGSSCAQNGVKPLSTGLAEMQLRLMKLVQTLDAIMPRGQPGVASRRKKVLALHKKCGDMMQALRGPATGKSRPKDGAGKQDR